MHEDADARDRLVAMGCDQAQGHLFAVPMPAGELADWLRTARRRSAGQQRITV